MVVFVFTANVVSCSSEETDFSQGTIILDDLQNDSSRLGDELGARDGSTVPPDITESDIAAALNAIGGEDLEDIIVTDIHIIEVDDVTGTLTFIVKYDNWSYTIVVEGFWGSEIKLLGDMVNAGKEIKISDFVILVEYFSFDPDITLVSDITKEQVISFVGLLNNQAYSLPESAYILTPNDEQGTLQIQIFYEIGDSVFANYDFTITGFATANP